MSYKLEKLLTQIRNSHVLVIGDLILDHFIWGKVNRISPEAPVPIVNVTKETFMPGGAANVALNVASLGGNVALCGVIGNDIYGEKLMAILKEKGIDTEGVVIDRSRHTILKTRIIAQHQHVVRVDREEIVENNSSVAKKIKSIVVSKLPAYNVIIFSDYAKGLINKTLCRYILEAVKDKQVHLLADPKVKNIHLFKNFFLVTPNKKEAFESLSLEVKDDEKSLIDVGRRLLKKLALKYLIITRGEEGMSLFYEDSHVRIPTFAQEVFDVSGAGDTVIATIACGLSCGLTVLQSAIISNIAASVVVGKMGTATTTISEISNRWKTLDKKIKRELEHLL